MYAFKEELLLGAFAFFIPNGVTVDTETVAIDNLPDDVPTTNWTAYALGPIERVKINKTVKESPRATPKATGGYDETPRRIVTGFSLDMTTSEYLELIHRAQLGAPAAITDGTAFTPFQTGGDDAVAGWLRIEAKDENGVTKINLIDWVEFRLTEIPEWSNEYGKPVLNFTVLGDDNGGLSTCVVNES